MGSMGSAVAALGDGDSEAYFPSGQGDLAYGASGLVPSHGMSLAIEVAIDLVDNACVGDGALCTASQGGLADGSSGLMAWAAWERPSQH